MPPKKKMKLTRDKTEIFLLEKRLEKISHVLQCNLYLRNLNPEAEKNSKRNHHKEER